MAFMIGIRILSPNPGRKKHVDGTRLHVPRRHSEDQRSGSLDLAPRHRHQVIRQKINVPVTEKSPWFAGMAPGGRNEVAERLPIKQGFTLLACRERGQGGGPG
jgi:hypothetical protein